VGEDHEPETHLIPLALEAAAGVGPQLTLHGDDYPTPDGTCIRDYVHVSDIAEAHVLALKALQAGAALRPAYNLGGGAGASVAEVIAAAARVTGRAVPLSVGPRRPGDPPVLVADARLAAADLGWRPRHDLDQMLATAWAWTQRQANLKGARRRAPAA
jgi:UDP-glucose 4-epimerase